MTNCRGQRKLLVWLLCGGCAVSWAATEPSLGKEQMYRVTRWTTDQGLPQNRISCLKQTRDGYLWIGTWFGLARFDGVRFTVFDKYNTPALVSDAINALAEDTEGTLWIATADGLLSYRGGQFRRFTVADGLSEGKVWRLVPRRVGGLWLQSGSVVARLEQSRIAPIWNFSGRPEGEWLCALHEAADGRLQAVMRGLVLTLSPEAGQVLTNFAADWPATSLLTGTPAKQAGIYWLGTPHGLQALESGVMKPLGPEEVSQGVVDFTYEDRTGNLWVNVQPGALFRWDHFQWARIDLEDAGAGTATICMEEDREGSLWLGTDHGLIQLHARQVRSYTRSDGLADDYVWSVCEGTDGTIWLGTGHGPSRIQNGHPVPLEIPELPWPGEAIRTVWPSHEGGVWLGKPGVGVFRFRGRLDTWIGAAPPSLPDPSLFALYQDHASRLWIGTGAGITVLEHGRVMTNFGSQFGQPVQNVRSILEDHEGTFWFGTQDHGLVRMREGKFDVFTTRDGLSSDRIWTIYEDAAGTLWLGTERGLTRYHDGSFFAFAQRHGLRENVVNWILEDNSGYFWLSGLRGIYRVNREQLNAVADGRTAAVGCAAFGTADGMESSETNGEGQPSGWKARDGRLWFPTTRGVVVIDPKTIELNEAPPPVVIEEVVAGDEIVFEDGSSAGLAPASSAGVLARRTQPGAGSRRGSQARTPSPRLPPGRARVLKVRYTANSFVAPDRIRFNYRLDGYDPAWREAEPGERVAVYTNLRPGDYSFHVRACNHHGYWSTDEPAFAFSIAPHFWQTWPFYVGCALGIIGLATGIQSYRLRWQHRLLKLEQQRALASERARIARDLHDDLGTALTGLALEAELARREEAQADGLRTRLSDLANRGRSLANRMREVVWAISPRCDTVESLGDFLGQYAEEFVTAAGLRCRLRLPDNTEEVSLHAEVRHQLFLAVKEALANVVKHAQAAEAELRMDIVDNELRITISDDGRGLDPEQRAPGHGLQNLRERLTSLGGQFRVESNEGQGTRLVLSVPLDPVPKHKGRA